MSITLKEVTIRQMKMKLKTPFTTSFGTFTDKYFLLLEAKDEDGIIGYGESVAFYIPWYNEETVATNQLMLEQFLIPLLFENPMDHPDEVSERFSFIRRNYMAKSAIEGAIWDLYAKKKGIPLAQALGGTKQEIDVGISIGIKQSMDELINHVEDSVRKGYKRIKVKIKPGWDVDVIKAVREQFPDIALMADANSAYRLEDAAHLKQLDDYGLMMIEQPLAHDDIIDHAVLQKSINTPICLDESIHSLEDAKKAVRMGSCKIINIKIGRVGGLTESKKIHDFCAANDIPVWCGGMLEAGVGRAHNIAITTLDQFILPGDTASSSNYWEKDIVQPEIVAANGTIPVPTLPGIGFEIDEEAVDQFTISKKVLLAPLNK